MVILKKIKAATLMETLVATVIIVVVFMMASLILNNTFSNQIKNNTHQLKNHLHELEYKYLSSTIRLPHQSAFKNWTISMYEDENTPKQVLISATQNESKRELFHFIHAY